MTLKPLPTVLALLFVFAFVFGAAVTANVEDPPEEPIEPPLIPRICCDIPAANGCTAGKGWIDWWSHDHRCQPTYNTHDCDVWVPICS